jgi:hypothetical protein
VIGKGPPPPIFAVFVVLGSAVTLAMLGYELVGLQYSAAVYITGLTIDFFTVAFAFVTALDVIALDVMMQQPMECVGRNSEAYSAKLSITEAQYAAPLRPTS